ncbi:MAG TPA: type ISP restriction/modification enzyme [Planctomycetota bacterium]|jgi:predicted helicase
MGTTSTTDGGDSITTTQRMSQRLAELATGIRRRVNQAIAAETKGGPLRKLHAAFRDAVVHDLSEDDFSDMCGQTIACALLSARMFQPGDLVSRELARIVPCGNPFLEELLQTFLSIGSRSAKIGPDELRIEATVEALRAIDMEAVLRDFGEKNPREDPFIHFYEGFLKEYDSAKRMRRGVFYTPRPVVSYVVSGVHELLQTNVGLEDGLASTITWGEMVKQMPGLEVPEGTSPHSHFVTLLDPATGTGTFLVEAIEVIHRALKSKWERQKLAPSDQVAEWNKYVPQHLLPRLFGYELMLAPYMIAHIKIGMKLRETGYRFRSEGRARIYLTNALEPAVEVPRRLFEDALALAHEARAVNNVKRTQRFTAIIGNPPYSVSSQNKNPWIDGLCAALKERVQCERNIQPLNDDYVKFLALAQHLRSMAGCGVLGMITNRSFINGKIHRGLRELLVKLYPAISILDLGGDTRSGETQRDDNVFDITQGVAVSLGCSSCVGQKQAYARLKGKRAAKYDALAARSIESWSSIAPTANEFLLTPQDQSVHAEYERFPSLRTLMPVSSPGVKTSNDAAFYAFTKEELREQVIAEGIGWDPGYAMRSLYRPLDWRWLYYDPVRLGRPRPELARHVLDGRTISLIAMRQIVNADISHFGVCRGICCHGCFFLGNKGQDYQFPLAVREEAPRGCEDAAAFVPNLSPEGQQWLASISGKRAEENSEAWLHYVYAVVHSPAYRTRYASLLKDDFPRLPLTEKPELFGALATIGAELVELHLLESARLERSMTEFAGAREPEIEKITYARNAVWIDREESAGFRGVPEEVWNFHVGGYQVCEKWLKDRKGRKLLKADIEHYGKIIVALSETICLMKQIDPTIDRYGGWPEAFSSDSKC